MKNVDDEVITKEAACEAVRADLLRPMGPAYFPPEEIVPRLVSSVLAAIRALPAPATVAEEEGFGAVNHRTDPRTMEERWRAMGFEVEWSDDVRAYVVYPYHWRSKPDTWLLPPVGATNHGQTAALRTVDEVEAFVVAHQEVNRG